MYIINTTKRKYKNHSRSFKIKRVRQKYTINTTNTKQFNPVLIL